MVSRDTHQENSDRGRYPRWRRGWYGRWNLALVGTGVALHTIRPVLVLLGGEMKKGLGWRPDLPDIRDYTVEHEAVQGMLAKLVGAAGVDPPDAMDLRAWCSPIDDQGELGACTAHAAAGMYEYFEQRAFGRFIDVSRLFLYKTTRNLAKLTGDSGAELRNAMGALALFGARRRTTGRTRSNRSMSSPRPFATLLGRASRH